uniref:Charged multivesicular body protein 4A n=1 Tax=Myotis myotis TaxID=51298 RepID=A0A7J8AM98_MYOMY|nr:hypothetical protein mMyoMyo1_008052 [Myotis myotis]
MWILAIFQFAIVTCLVTIFQGSLIPASHGFISEATDKGLHSCEIRKSGGQLPDFWAIYLLLRDIDKVDELMADITEQQEVAQQISDAISRPVGFADDVDEDELLEELEELEQEELARELLHVGDKEEEPPVKLPSVPSTHLPAGPAPKADEDEDALKQLAEWVS